MSDEEPSVLDYARFYGLALDHLAVDPLENLKTLPEAQVLFEDGPDSFQITEDSIRIPEERLSVDVGASSLLSEVFQLAKSSPLIDYSDYIDTHRIKRLKVEQPLLHTDPDIDSQLFAPPVDPDLENESLPLETIDEEADEGLTLPSSYDRLADEHRSRIQNEKLEVGRETLAFLQDALYRPQKEEEPATFEDVGPTYKKVSLRLSMIGYC